MQPTIHWAGSLCDVLSMNLMCEYHSTLSTLFCSMHRLSASCTCAEMMCIQWCTGNWGPYVMSSVVLVSARATGYNTSKLLQTVEQICTYWYHQAASLFIIHQAVCSISSNCTLWCSLTVALMPGRADKQIWCYPTFRITKNRSTWKAKGIFTDVTNVWIRL
jgi:hypothetical protein